MKFDVVSDLHVDRWLEKPVMWSEVKNSDLLIVAGDVADDLDLIVVELKKMAEAYNTILYIDGNHEHQKSYPDFESSITYLKDQIQHIPQVKFLHDQIYIENGTAFVARCGWWDFKIAEPRIKREQSKEYLQRCFRRDMSDVMERKAYEDACWITIKICELQGNDKVNNIVIFTHTLPRRELLSWNIYPEQNHAAGCYGNSLLSEVPEVDRKRKITHWIFGHNHDQKDRIIDGIRYLSNPRGRPKDFNRESYKPLTISVGGE